MYNINGHNIILCIIYFHVLYWKVDKKNDKEVMLNNLLMY